MTARKTATVALYKTDHGMGGIGDAVTTLVGTFTNHTKAVKYLEAIGHTHIDTGWYWHHDVKYRHTMGAISYAIKPAEHNPVPHNPKPPKL